MISRFFTKHNTMKKITVLKNNRELKEEQRIIAKNYAMYSNSDIEEFSLTDYFKNNKGLNTYERTSRLRVAKII